MGTHPIFESDFDCLTETGKMAQNTKKTWQSKLDESDINFVQAINNSTSCLFKEATLPVYHAAKAKEWQSTLKANRNLVQRYRIEKENAVKLKDRIIQYQGRFTELMVEN